MLLQERRFNDCKGSETPPLHWTFVDDDETIKLMYSGPPADGQGTRTNMTFELDLVCNLESSRHLQLSGAEDWRWLFTGFLIWSITCFVTSVVSPWAIVIKFELLRSRVSLCLPRVTQPCCVNMHFTCCISYQCSR